MRKSYVFAWILLISGTAMLIAGGVLAYIKMETQLTFQGPDVVFNEGRTYWIDDHVVPPIDRGTQIELRVSASRSGGPIYVFLYPLSYMMPPIGEPGGVPIATGIVNSTSQFLFSGKAPISDQYVVELVIYNNTYTGSLHSTFPPFYGLRVLIIPGLLTLPAGLALLYYDKLRVRRDRMYSEAVEVAT
jgi:hypothetical protein